MRNLAVDRILIRDLAARCIIGVNEEERREKQDVLVNLTLYADIRKACKSDQFEDTVDYRSIKKQILQLVELSRYYLIEALAEAIAEVCLTVPKVVEVRVRVEKPSALRFAKTVGIELVRTKRG